MAVVTGKGPRSAAESLQAWGIAARFTHNQNSNVLSLESELYNVVGAALEARGHEVRPVTGGAVGFVPVAKTGPMAM